MVYTAEAKEKYYGENTSGSDTSISINFSRTQSHQEQEENDEA